ncbi:MAG: IS4 family transposase [Candidatus Aminicenantales bacterium]
MDEKTIERYTGLITHLRQLVSSDEFVKRHRQREQDFTRQRCLSFMTVVLFLINLIKRALQDELDEFFKLIQPGPGAERVVTKSAFSQARQKLKPSAFVELNQAQVSYFYDQFEPARWHGLRLLAMDGSLADLPNTAEVRAHFGVWRPASGGECPKARLSQLFDVSNKITLDALIAPKAQGERALAEQHCHHLTATDLVLLDRGYPAFWLFVAIRARQAHFCARMSLTQWKVVADFVASGQTEQLLHLQPGWHARQACQQRQLPTDALPVRLLRLEVGQAEPIVLITSLVETDQFPYAELQDLSLSRWPIETDYRHIKHRLEVENWTGLTVVAIYQDFQATVFTKNLAALVAQPVQPVVEQLCASRQHAYQINWANLFSKLKDTVVQLFVAANPGPLFQHLWQQMTRTLEPVRPNRSFPRKKRVKPRRFAMSYKPLR